MRRLVTSPAHSLGDLAAAAGYDSDARTDAVAIGWGSFEPEGHVVSDPRRLVVKVGDRFVLGEDDGIDTAVVVEIAGSEAPSDALHGPGHPRLR